MELINEFPLSKLPLKIDLERTPNIIDITKYNIIVQIIHVSLWGEYSNHDQFES